MPKLTKRQQQILDFIERTRQASGFVPSAREIAAHFEFSSPGTVADHLRAISEKGFLSSEPGRARSLTVTTPLAKLRKRTLDIPVFGSVPAGFADDRNQEAKGCVTVDVGSIGVKPSARTFALEVRGESMIGKHIMDGDVVVVEHGMTPRNGDVVAALIDGESTLKTFITQRGKPFLRAENPEYPDLVPANELVIQGVMVALIRKRK